MHGSRINVNLILDKALNKLKLAEEEVIFLLNLEKANEIEDLFSAARKMRTSHFSDRVFVYGFIYFSTYCKNNCNFCYYRSSNETSERYRKSKTDIIDTAGRLAQSGVHLLDLTMGEDPFFSSTEHSGRLVDIVKEVKKISGLPLMISPGLVTKDILGEFRDAGVDWYALYQETHNRELYNKLRLNQDYDERLKIKIYARKIGFLIEEGLLAGVGESTADICHSFRVMDQIAADQVRIMSFIPQKGTPMENYQTIPRLRELLVIAVMRLLFPDRLIPASLDVDGLSGLKERINAGANVITSIIPPDDGLLGVSQSTLDIREGGRSVAGVIPVLEDCRMQLASQSDYQNWIDFAKNGYQPG